VVFKSIILFLAAILGGAAYFLFPKVKHQQFSSILVFAGSYLFAITIVHILPEVYSFSSNGVKIGGFILLGFFLQLLLESFTSGIEHGHIHNGHLEENMEINFSPWLLLIGLCLHALMDGTIVANPEPHSDHHHAEGLLLGIVMHKIPAAFALMTILVHYIGNRKVPLVLLTIFALASPVGLIASEFLIRSELIGEQGVSILFAIVCGSFLHIATTIFFESNPGHRFSLQKALVSLAGAGVAVLAELFL